MPVGNSTGPLSGIYGLASVDATLVQHLGKWSINPKVESADIAHSATSAATDRVEGNYDWDGSYMAYGDNPIVWPGSYFTFSGSMNDDPTSYGTLGYTGAAICDEISLKLDVEGGKPISHDVKFSGNGALTSTYGLDQGPDVDYTAVVSATACKAYLGTLASPSVYTTGELMDVRSMDISIKCANKAYNSSATAGYTKRVPGLLDVNCSVNLYVQGGSGFNEVDTAGAIVSGSIFSLPKANSKWALKMMTSATRYWEFAWVITGQKSGIDVDRQSGNIIGLTLNFGFKATAPSLLGWIKDPAGTIRWPN